MKYKTLPEQRNIYPIESGSVETYENYFDDNGSAILQTGKYPKDNWITFNSVSLSSLKVSSLSTSVGTDFQFIIQFEDGGSEQWTSVSFKKKLQEAQLEPNPYFTRGRVTVAQIDYGTLKDYWTRFNEAEKFAQVVIDTTIQTKDDIIDHINWMVNPKDDALRPAGNLGKWTVNDPILINGVDITAPEPLPPESNAVADTVPAAIIPNYEPYGVPGDYIGYIRYKRIGGFLGIFRKRIPEAQWTGTNWIIL